jgi:hypothetical protein
MLLLGLRDWWWRGDMRRKHAASQLLAGSKLPTWNIYLVRRAIMLRDRLRNHDDAGDDNHGAANDHNYRQHDSPPPPPL